MSSPSPIDVEAARIRASGILGKTGALTRLFDFLLERSQSGEAPKEIEIAYKVFGKDSAFDVAQDSVVRVYIHKLRKRLDDYYASHGGPARLAIPRGEYRLVLEQAGTPGGEAIAQEGGGPAQLGRRAAIISALLIGLLLGAAAAYLAMRPADTQARVESVRHSALWAPLFADELPITLVVGDYYMMGEVDESGQIRRLVREFFVNSPDDFVRHVESSPQLMERYRNLNFTYLPTSIGFALKDLVPLFGHDKQVRVMLVSELRGSMLANSHIVYVGFLSGLGILSDPVFAGSRIELGGSYDELSDSRTGESYRSTAADAVESRYLDYGLISTFPGPGENRVVVLAGTRDTGVAQAAHAASNPEVLAQISKNVGEAASFESLLEIHGMARSSLNSKVLFASPLDTARLWDMPP